MEPPSDTAPTPGEPSSPAPVARRWRRRWLLVLIALFCVFEVRSLVRGALGVRAVIYNDGPAALEEAVLGFAGAGRQIGALDVDASRYEWLRPPERTGVVGLSWSAAGERHETAWAVERGDRLTLRVRSDGEVTVTREQSLGRKLFDIVSGD
jgi:hypothetical protein